MRKLSTPWHAALVGWPDLVCVETGILLWGNLRAVGLLYVRIWCLAPTPSALRCREPVVQTLQFRSHQPEWFVTR